MTTDKPYSLAYSPCPNDTFIFKAIAKQLMDIEDYSFKITLEDVETLNQHAAKGTFDITKLSFAAFGKLMDKYALLRTGSALGEGCGPLIISLPEQRLPDKKKPVVAVPGMGTTAYHLFRFYMDARYPGLKTEVIAMPFEKIMPAVLEKKADFGVIIHEGRFVFQGLGLKLLADLGQWWEDTTGLPIPLGCIAIKRDIAPHIACAIQKLISASIKHAFSHPQMGREYIRQYAQEMDETVIQQHIELYVNDFSKDIGPKGEKAICAFFEKAQSAGLIQVSDKPIFAC